MTSRRDLLRLAGLGAIAACAPYRRSDPPPLASPAPSRTGPTLAQLRSSLDGQLLVSGDPGFPAAHQLFNPLFDDVRPAAVVQAASEADVARAITFARDNDMPITVRSGGHCYTGKSTGNGLVVDVRQLNHIIGNGGLVTIGPGAQLGAVYSKLNAEGVSISGGSCPTVGISGLLMGGGYGVVAPQQGLTCDALVSARIVTPDGETVTVTADRNADLFWLLRGGAHAPGIVTEWQLSTFPTQDVVIYSLSWPWQAADHVLAAWMGWLDGLPDETFSTCKLLATDDHAAGSMPTVGVYGMHQGSVASLIPHLSELTNAVGTRPRSTTTTPHTFADAMTIEAGRSSARESFIASSDFLHGRLDAVAINSVIAAVEDRQQNPELIRGGSSFDRFSGAIGTIRAHDTAFAHRDAHVLVQHTATLTSAAVDPADRGSLADLHHALVNDATGGAYANYLDSTIPSPGVAYFGDNLARVRRIMAAHDPDARFARPDLTG